MKKAAWMTADLCYNELPWVVDAMESFHTKQNKWEQRLCTICHKAWPSKTCLLDDPSDYACLYAANVTNMISRSFLQQMTWTQVLCHHA